MHANGPINVNFTRDYEDEVEHGEYYNELSSIGLELSWINEKDKHVSPTDRVYFNFLYQGTPLISINLLIDYSICMHF